ncbi:hypothetical protein CANCADRAFT_31032 [Tortispora caseinolytica NRRL Y-17796]|uniref:Ribokinase n=1 Tax=Tortispora caseinolytica NRRL Y-17796 TaxID=767744 RepID=A0A1E4TE04_9ASCO|nr:hypothetical protein CANCADRAFT_31032 [Tortispora caseinolytica NRRL Y-17796]
MSSIIVLGSLNADLVTTTDIVPKGGETVQANGFQMHKGGKGSNQALALARLGQLPVKMIGCVGDDQFADPLIDNLKQSNVDTSLIKRIQGVSSGVATIIVESSGENRILVAAGSNGHIHAEDIDPAWFTDAVALVVQNEIPKDAVFRAIEIANDKNVPVAYNPSPVWDVPDNILAMVTYLVVNEGELAAITNTQLDENLSFETFTTLATSLHSKGVKSLVVTLGSNGAFYSTPSSAGHVPAQKVSSIVDTTGAGDTFLGAIVTKVCSNSSIKEAIEFATKASAIVVSRPGAASSIPTYDEIK